jgi:hypothetical protein
MLKFRRKLVTGAAVSAALALTGISAASAHARPAVSGTEHVQLMTTSATAKTSSVIAYGVFTAGGSQTSTSNTTATVTFPNGTFKITHSKGAGTQHFDPKTCLLQINLKGTYTLGSGTGAYANLSGSGNYQLSILAIGAKSGGKCSTTLPPSSFQQVIKASGAVSLH